jgi:hypothetical protein
VNAVLNALEDWKPMAKAISPMLRVPRCSSSLARAILQCSRYSIGPVPTILRNRAARVERDDVREKLAAGIDPGEAKRLEKHAVRLVAANSFEVVAHGWNSFNSNVNVRRNTFRVAGV